MKVLHSLTILVAAVTVSVASPVIRPAAVYGPPPGAYQRYQLARGALTAPPPPPAHPLPAPPPYRPAPPPPPPQYGAPYSQGYQRAPARPPFGYPDSFVSFSRGLGAPVQQRPQAYKTYIQGIWRYTAPVFPPPIQEDEVPHQGLGASDSVTMPEQAPFDPLLSPNPAYHVKALSDREPHFFTEFPHTRLVLSNQQKRLDNGLHANRLGSIRPGSDFLRGD